MPPSVILAGASVRSLAESAIRCGLQPLCFDRFADEDLQYCLKQAAAPTATQLPDWSSLPDLTARLAPDIPLIWCGGLENSPDILEALWHQRPVGGMSPAQVRQCRDHQFLLHLARSAGWNVPDIARTTEPPADGAWLQKPHASGGGQDIRTWAPGQPVAPDRFLQKYISGTSLSATFQVQPPHFQLLAVTAQVTGCAELGAHDQLWCGNMGPVPTDTHLLTQLQRLGKALSLEDIHGILGVDFIRNEDGMWLLEINPRITASHEITDLVTPTHPLLRRQLPGQQHISTARTTQEKLARLIVYVRDTSQLSADLQHRLRSWSVPRRVGTTERHTTGPRPAVWLADIPPAGPLAPGIPLCSLYCRWFGNDGPPHLENEIELLTLLQRTTGIPDLPPHLLQQLWNCLSV